MRRGRVQFFVDPGTAPPLSAQQIGEALARAAVCTEETGVLARAAEKAIGGQLPLRARWIAYAALLALHQSVDPYALGDLLGCGQTPLRSLARMRGNSWWDEACVDRVFVDLANAVRAPELQP